MRNRQTTPAADRAAVIQNVIAFRPAPGRLILPDLCCDITIVNGVSYFTGPMTRATVSPHVNQEVLLFRLNVAAARQLVGGPLSELTDCVVPLNDVARSLGGAVAKALETGRLDDLARAALQSSDARFVRAARALSRGMAVRAAADSVALSERQLERLVFDRAGVSPKKFGRIARFRRAVLAARAGALLAEVAVTHGYADQSHFAKDVHAFTGRSWRSLLGHFGDVGFVQDADRLASVGCE